MKLGAIAVAAAVVLSPLPVASAEGLHERNVRWILDGLEGAGIEYDYQDVEFAAYFNTLHGVDLRAVHDQTVPPTAPDPMSTHVGNAFVQCFVWFAGTCSGLTTDLTVPPTAAFPCFVRPNADLPLVYGPHFLKADFSGPRWELLAWTEGRLGLPLSHPGWTGTGVGTLCFVANFPWFVTVGGNGAWLGD